jgi:hypothetical protein
MTKNSVWECFLLFADAATLCGQEPLAREIRQILINYAPANISIAIPRS